MLLKTGRHIVCTLAVLGALAAPAAAQTTLKVALHSDLKIIDPIWTSAYNVRNYGYMVYDTLFAVDDKLAVQPQMVEAWKVSDDKLVYTYLPDLVRYFLTEEPIIPNVDTWRLEEPEALTEVLDRLKKLETAALQRANPRRQLGRAMLLQLRSACVHLDRLLQPDAATFQPGDNRLQFLKGLFECHAGDVVG